MLRNALHHCKPSQPQQPVRAQLAFDADQGSRLAGLAYAGQLAEGDLLPRGSKEGTGS